MHAKKYNIPTSFITNLVFWCVVFGLLGARIYYVLFNLDYYASSPIEIIKIWNGGLAIHGGIIAGLITLVVYCKKYQVNILKMLDIAAPALLLAQGIGRWGNFFNGEAHGGIVTRSFLEGLHLPEFIIDGMHIGGHYYHPTFLYESVGCVIGFLLIYFVVRRFQDKQGYQFFSYFIWYGFIRFFIEGLRTDSLYVLGLKTAQLTSVVFVIAGVIGIIYCYFKGEKVRE